MKPVLWSQGHHDGLGLCVNRCSAVYDLSNPLKQVQLVEWMNNQKIDYDDD